MVDIIATVLTGIIFLGLACLLFGLIGRKRRIEVPLYGAAQELTREEEASVLFWLLPGDTHAKLVVSEDCSKEEFQLITDHLASLPKIDPDQFNYRTKLKVVDQYCALGGIEAEHFESFTTENPQRALALLREFSRGGAASSSNTYPTSHELHSKSA